MLPTKKMKMIWYQPSCRWSRYSSTAAPEARHRAKTRPSPRWRDARASSRSSASSDSSSASSASSTSSSPSLRPRDSHSQKYTTVRTKPWATANRKMRSAMVKSMQRSPQA